MYTVSMTGDNMKSEILNRPQAKLARIQNKSRRKMAAVDMNLEAGGVAEQPTLCGSENIKCSKFAEFSKFLESRLDKTIEGNNNDTKVGSDEPKLSKEESQETRHLKELLLLHLDLIQQQQELIHMKDRQLQQITQEKETLRCRLERMERRMSLLRSRGDAQADLTDTEADAAPHKFLSDSKVTTNRGIKRKHSLEPQSLVKKFATFARNEYQRSHQNSAPTPKSKPHKDSAAATPSRTHKDSQSDREDNSSQGSTQSHVSHKSNRSKDSLKNKTKITLRTSSKKKKEAKSRRIPKKKKVPTATLR